MVHNCDFSGYATRNNIRCSDGRTIRKDAFKHQDGAKVPLIWNHEYSDPSNVLGHAYLENREDGVYVYGVFNGTPNGRDAKEQVLHGDITALSIHANQLRQSGGDVLHGMIREVSLVLAGANPGALIENVIRHGEILEDDVCIFTGENFQINHSDSEENQNDSIISESEIEHAESSDAATSEESNDNETVADIFNTFSEKQKKVVYALMGRAMEDSDDSENDSDVEHSESMDDSGDETVEDVFNTLTEKQKKVAYYLISVAADKETEDVSHSDLNNENEGGSNEMKNNIFEGQQPAAVEGGAISHDEIQAMLRDGKRYGSLKESAIQHGMEEINFLSHGDSLSHGVENVGYLFPDHRNLTNTPIFIQRDMAWVANLMAGVKRSPFSRVKSVFADITEEAARAKGYIKGRLKKDEVFGLLKRTTDPTTVYKKQKMDRDDVVDIVDLDIVGWIKSEMRQMLNEELARAILVGDGRLAGDDDKINEGNIRPIWKDEELFTIKARFDGAGLTDGAAKAKKFIETCIRARKDYKGSGTPTLYTTEDVLTECLLLTDEMGRDLYDTVDKLVKKLRVKEIVTVPVMEGLSRNDNGSDYDLFGIIVNPADYNVGADKGGAVNLFDDFDIDYNAQKYLIETRCSGALTRPFSAISVEMKRGA